MKAINFFKALADETRLRLLNIFLQYELNVNEIVSILGMGQSRISRHLKILSDSGLLTFRRDGLWTFYSAVSKGEGSRVIESIKFLLAEETVFVDDLLKAKTVLEERSKETVRFFDAIAEDWEKLKREIIGEVDLNRLILENVSPSDTVVDLGCGTGDLLVDLSRKANRVIGVEKSPRMLESARRRLDNGFNNVDLRIGELEHLPVRENEADLGVVSMVLHHLREPIRAIQEAHRVLKKGTAFIVVDLLAHELESMRERYGDRWLGFSESDMRKWLTDSGFEAGSSVYFPLKKGLQGFLVRAVKV